MIRVGLTGAVGSGKSTVAGLLADHGAAVCDADRVVAELYAPGRAGAKAVAELFGPGMLDEQGGVNREHLARLVLSDAESRLRLERVVHPLVRGELDRWMAGLRPPAEGLLVAVVEAALLVETGEHLRYHRLVVVVAPQEVRRRRALAMGRDPARFSALNGVQAGDRRRREAADYVVGNDGSLSELKRSVARLWQYLVEDARSLVSQEGLPRRSAVPVQL